MPPLKLLKSVVDRMKNLSNFVLLSANQRGQMKVKVQTDLVTVTTYFNDLDHPTWSMCTYSSVGSGCQECYPIHGFSDYLQQCRFIWVLINLGLPD